ncbi:Similar to RpL37A: 60S ribosomal protein L37a (Drosophila melanogaster) [Cotesia congregata]|uniref:Similar to RpL37A: 60S ribosomal protein L37a (Drosophila melanogaster) n=1 Tax=Cotesia congregata TaxID=51543 RepID=A0A8J2HEG3_COTCN|nr:Similar to RpL37A: 60S ribosomal protein L37a (Drosophila melanogaster) [Cotesia congregata]
MFLYKFISLQVHAVLHFVLDILDAMKRSVVGIWSCKRCKRTVAGGAWVYSTTAAASVRSAVRRLREVKEQ